jgi:hypothetical protein
MSTTGTPAKYTAQLYLYTATVLPRYLLLYINGAITGQDMDM